MTADPVLEAPPKTNEQHISRNPSFSEAARAKSALSFDAESFLEIQDTPELDLNADK
jgi:hypothetical protein